MPAEDLGVVVTLHLKASYLADLKQHLGVKIMMGNFLAEDPGDAATWLILDAAGMLPKAESKGGKSRG